MRISTYWYFIASIPVIACAYVALGQVDDDEVDDFLKNSGELLQSFEDDSFDDKVSVEPADDVTPPAKDGNEPFRSDNALMPNRLLDLDGEEEGTVDPPIDPEPSPRVVTSGSSSGAMAVDPLDALSIDEQRRRYEAMTLEQMLRNVKRLPEGFEGQGNSGSVLDVVDLLPNPDSDAGQGTPNPDSGSVAPGAGAQDPRDDGSSSPTYSTREIPMMDSSEVKEDPEDEPYVVLDGDRLDGKLAEKIREAIQHTRMAHSGTGYPGPNASVDRAVNYCNKVLVQLGEPEHKQYRRDLLLALVKMFERCEMWVEAAKTRERCLEEFASDAKYPFENGEDMPTIAEMHIELGRIYRRIGAFRMAKNKFYDGLNATLAVPKEKAFAFKRIADEAMLEIAETHLDMEDYDNAIKYFSRLLKVSRLHEIQKGSAFFKHAYAHYQRARMNLRHEARMKDDPKRKHLRPEYEPGKAPEADLAKVRHDLRGFAQRFPESQYVPESYYLLALTHDQLHEKDDALKQVEALLRTSPYNPIEIDKALDNPQRKIDTVQVSRDIALWNFWKKKTGNYLANEFFEEGDYFKALRVYQALSEIDDEPSWKIPIRYQMGLCHERLGHVGEARRVYTELVEAPIGEAENVNVQLVRDMAKNRLNFVGWATAADKLLLKAAARSRP